MGATFSVPVFVEGIDSPGHIGSPFAPGLDQFIGQCFSETGKEKDPFLFAGQGFS